MSWRTSRAVILLRDAGRMLGINRLIAAARGGGYEDAFQKAMLAAVRPGDTVWDIGANVGFYTTKFSALVGAAGRVVAFEPSPDNLRRLHEFIVGKNNVTVLPIALGEREARVRLEQGCDSLGATSRIIDGPALRLGNSVEIPVASGDQVIASGNAPLPNVIKIDTEGFELDVLCGLRHALPRRELRILCIEVHFSLLKDRGLSNAPSDIEAMLASAGFAVEWPDSSHIVATRVA